MRVLLSSLVALTIGSVALAKPNELTPKEAAEGWLLLFDGQSTAGWTVEGEATVQDGVLKLGGTKPAKITSLAKFGAFTLTYETGADGKEWSEVGQARVAGDTTAEAIVLAAKDKPRFFRSIRVQPSKMQSLFNGKDLTGWKVFPGAKDRKVSSVFSVTKEGWLNVKNGPGDLQTEGQWADFIVQLECISNGKHLNSGLFFRCLPDQYQMGYEAQIRNEWMGDDRTKPVDFGTGAIYRRQPARKVVSTDGEWFTLTVAACGKHLATWVNGEPIVNWTDDRKDAENARQGAKVGKGAMSIQGHDPTTDLSFRNIRIQSLDGK